MASLPSSQLSPRDHAILATVHQLGQVSAGQLQRLHFADGSPVSRGSRMRRTMARLVRWGVVARVSGRWVGGHQGGSVGYLYQRPGSRSRSYLEHRLLVSELFVRLTEEARTGSFRLLDFAAEPACHRLVGSTLLKPDAWLRLERGAERQVFVELDRGTESGRQIAAKLTVYAAASRVWPRGDGAFPWVVFVVAHESPAGEVRQLQLIQRVIERHPDSELFAAYPFDAIPFVIGG